MARESVRILKMSVIDYLREQKKSPLDYDSVKVHLRTNVEASTGRTWYEKQTGPELFVFKVPDTTEVVVDYREIKIKRRPQPGEVGGVEDCIFIADGTALISRK